MNPVAAHVILVRRIAEVAASSFPFEIGLSDEINVSEWLYLFRP